MLTWPESPSITFCIPWAKMLTLDSESSVKPLPSDLEIKRSFSTKFKGSLGVQLALSGKV